MELGYRLETCGAEIFRVEDSISRLFRAYRVRGDVYAVNSCIVVSLVGEDGIPMTRMRRIPGQSINLGLLEAYNDVSRRLCTQTPDYIEARDMLRQARWSIRRYPAAVIVAGAGISAAAYCLCRQAVPQDVLWAGICGVTASLVSTFLRRRGATAFFQTLVCSFLVTLLACVLRGLDLVENLEPVLVGGLLLLFPGLLFTNFIRDMISGDTTAGIGKLAEAMVAAVAIAGGAALAMGVAVQLFGDVADVTDTVAGLPFAARCLLTGLIGVGVCLLLNVHGSGIVIACLATTLGSSVNLILERLGLDSWACRLAAGAAIAIFAECMARARHCPASAYLVVALYPLVPGSVLYSALRCAIVGNVQGFLTLGSQALAIAGCLATGASFVSAVVRMSKRYTR